MHVSINASMEMKNTQGAGESESRLLTCNKMLHAQMLYLLLWQWVWILRAAGLLLFLNKAFFLTDQGMKKILRAETKNSEFYQAV